MKFIDIYNRIRTLYPNKISLKHVEKIDNDGYFFPALSKAWDTAEKKVQDKDEWGALMAWSIFGVTHEEAIKKINNQEKEIIIDHIDKRLFQKKFRQNLQEKSYKNMLKIYKG